MNRLLALIIAVLVAFVALGCTLIGSGQMVIGSGNPASEDRTVSAFTELSAEEGVRVTATIGSPQAVRVTADDNILAYVETTVSGSRLSVGMTGSTSGRTPVTVAITVPALTFVSTASGAFVSVNGLAAESFTARTDSGGMLTASGSAIALDIESIGGGGAELTALSAGSVNAVVESGGRATVNTSGAVTGRAVSGGILIIVGSPTSVDVPTESGAQVIRS